MSKRKRRRRDDRVNSQSSTDFGNNMPFGINPSQLMNLFGGNIDFNQIGNMLSSMKIDGLDLNNFNLNQEKSNSNAKEFDFSPLQKIMSNLGMNNFNVGNNNVSPFEEDSNISYMDSKENNQEVEEARDEDFFEEDENVQMLIAIKSIVDSKKAIFLDRVIEAYNKGFF